jgi:hypothetical protein
MRLDDLEGFTCGACGNDHVALICTTESEAEAEDLRNWVGRLRQSGATGDDPVGYFNWQPLEPERHERRGGDRVVHQG